MAVEKTPQRYKPKKIVHQMNDIQFSNIQNIIHIIFKYTAAQDTTFFKGVAGRDYAAASSGIPLYPRDRVILRSAG